MKIIASSFGEIILIQLPEGNFALDNGFLFQTQYHMLILELRNANLIYMMAHKY